jgi:hypothetical protein
MSASGSRPRSARAGLVAILLAVALAGCQVTTAVGVQVRPDGTGSVTVGVEFDRAAVAAVGGIDGQLHVADLQAAGWRVTSTAVAGGGTLVSLAHPFSRPSEVPAILAEVGRAPTGARTPLFTLRLAEHRTFWSTTTTARGAVDLTCGLACFGDTGLQRSYGSELGVSPTYLGGAGGPAVAAAALRFSFRLRLPGRILSSDASPGRPGLRWAPVLGATTTLSAGSVAPDVSHIVEASAAAALAVIFLAVAVVTSAGSRRRPTRRRDAHRR